MQEVDLEYPKFAEFRKLNQPSFRVAFNPDRAEEWVKVMEKVFLVLAYTEYQKVAFASYMLETDAKFRWTIVKRLLEASQTDITWEIFKETFYHKYFPAFIRNAKELEFIQLQQEGRSMSEYIAMFEELCKFSIIYQRNPDEAQKCVKFKGGLKENILAVVGPIEIKDFATLVNKCRLVEEYNKKLKIAKSDAYKKRLMPESLDFEHTLPPKKQFQPSGYEGKQPPGLVVKQECPKRERYHGSRPCFTGQNVYFKCRKLGHIVRNGHIGTSHLLLSRNIQEGFLLLVLIKTTPPEELKRDQK